jgi:hypothetical protein
MLKKDKNVLMHELVRLRQQQQNTEQDLRVHDPLQCSCSVCLNGNF